MRIRNHGRLLAVLVGCLVTTGLTVQPGATTTKALPTTTRLSISSSGAQANLPSYAVAITPDGRYVAFTSVATNLVPGDTNGTADAFVRDRQTGETTRVSITDSGEETASSGAQEGGSVALGITPDGRYVLFRSDAPNVVAGTNRRFNVFVRDRVRGRTTRVSVSSTGRAGNALSQSASISADGRYVVFESQASNLVPGDTNRSSDIFVHDGQTGRTSRVSVSSRMRQGNGASYSPAISADGRYVAFDSHASNLVPRDTNRANDIFLNDRRTGRTSLVSVSSRNTQGNRRSEAAALSADGRYVAFASVASNLVSKDTNHIGDIFVRDRVTHRTRRVSVSSRGAQANRFSGPLSISPEGRYVGFESLASNLVASDRNKATDVFVHDSKTGRTTLASLGARGTQGNTYSVLVPSGDALSTNSRYVIFYSPASNLVARDTNGVDDVFVRDFGKAPPGAAP
jgi:archaellum component FlaF (FlaF/FlaG flagellin family)